jgi:ketosteroid isomerase-like protein
MAMTTQQTQQALDEYLHALLNHGDFASHFSDDVVVTVEGTDQRFTGRNAARDWITAAHSLGEIKLHKQFTGEGHAATEAEFIRKDGRSVPYAVIYDFAAGKITALRLYFTGPVQ